MITKDTIDTLLEIFLVDLHNARVSTMEKALDVVDCVAIDLMTSVSSIIQKSINVDIEEAEAEECQNKYAAAIDTVSDAVKRIVQTENVTERLQVYDMLVDTLTDEQEENPA